MPPKAKVTKEAILSAALDILREKGSDGLNARQLAKVLACSTQPIFSNYASMEALRLDLMELAWRHYTDFAHAEMATDKYPPYKSYGMAYITFAAREPELFRLLFMSRRTAEDANIGAGDVEKILDGIQAGAKLSRESAEKLHGEMWVFVHGAAVLLSSGTIHWDMEFVSRMLTDVYMGLRNHFAEQEGSYGCHCDKESSERV